MPDNNISEYSDDEEEDNNLIFYYIDDIVKFLVRFDIDTIPIRYLLLRCISYHLQIAFTVHLYVLNKILDFIHYITHEEDNEN